MPSLSSFRSSRFRNSSSGELNLRINLQTNAFSTAPGPESEDLPAQPSDASAGSSASPGRRQVSRKAIASRKYHQWPVDPRSSRGVGKDADNERAVVPPGSGGEGAEMRRGRDRSNTGGRAGRGSEESLPMTRKAGRARKPTEISEIDVLYENQRGIFMWGIPLFSSNGLLNLDPAPWQNGLFHDSAVSIVNAQVPDPSWVWAWKTWYVDMTLDVDEEGWTYSFSFNPAFSWHGAHVWFHSFVRRRRWLRKRVKLPRSPDFSSREGSQERPHGLDQDYFTIHARQLGDGGSAGRRRQRRSVMGGSEWIDHRANTGDDLEEEGLIADIPKLMRVLKMARLDREKIEVVERFLKEGGEEVAYIPDRIHDIMSLMIFQASRRQLQMLFIEELHKLKASSSPPPPQTPSSEYPDPVPPQPPQHPSETTEADKTAAKQIRIKHLERAIRSAEQEVRRLEYWSDVRRLATESPGGLKVTEDQSGGLPLGLDEGDTKSKGKEVQK